VAWAVLSLLMNRHRLTGRHLLKPHLRHAPGLVLLHPRHSLATPVKPDALSGSDADRAKHGGRAVTPHGGAQGDRLDAHRFGEFSMGYVVGCVVAAHSASSVKHAQLSTASASAALSVSGVN